MTACRLCAVDPLGAYAHEEEPYGHGQGLSIAKEREQMPEDYELTERLYTDAEKTRIVPENHPDASYLLGVPGDRIPHDEAVRLGLRKSRDTRHEPAESGDTGARAEASGRATIHDKAVRGPKE